jgi:hypothetical protein
MLLAREHETESGIELARAFQVLAAKHEQSEVQHLGFASWTDRTVLVTASSPALKDAPSPRVRAWRRDP